MTKVKTVKNSDIKIQEQLQKQFEQHIELMITYKKSHLEEDVYLNQESLNKVLKWYNNIVKDISPELINKCKEELRI